jgi:hypothetical protein
MDVKYAAIILHISVNTPQFTGNLVHHLIGGIFYLIYSDRTYPVEWSDDLIE